MWRKSKDAKLGLVGYTGKAGGKLDAPINRTVSGNSRGVSMPLSGWKQASIDNGMHDTMPEHD